MPKSPNDDDRTPVLQIVPKQIVAVPTLPKIAFVEARFYRRGPRREPARWLILHATHGAEGIGKALACAKMFATLPPDTPSRKRRSSHVAIDTTTVVQAVPWESEAYHCGHTGNQFGEGIELCGSADQTREQWFDANSLPMLDLAAHVIRWRCQVLQIPIEFRSATELRARIPGVTTHAEITRAFPQDTSHYDPGPHFPIHELLEAARA